MLVPMTMPIYWKHETAGVVDTHTSPIRDLHARSMRFADSSKPVHALYAGPNTELLSEHIVASICQQLL